MQTTNPMFSGVKSKPPILPRKVSTFADPTTGKTLYATGRARKKLDAATSKVDNLKQQEPVDTAALGKAEGELTKLKGRLVVHAHISKFVKGLIEELTGGE